ncbi:MAG: hypothetical protein JXC31_00320 [Acholeplasmataceae bacterium]|nr:hypothetical protein [Acholeplasmataceae bacterium]
MATITLKGAGQASSIALLLENEISNSGISINLLSKHAHKVGDELVYMLVFDKFYYRNGNRASLSILITEQDGMVTVDATGSGGGKGIFINFSLGAETNFVNLIERVLIQKGFKVIG